MDEYARRKFTHSDECQADREGAADRSDSFRHGSDTVARIAIREGEST